MPHTGIPPVVRCLLGGFLALGLAGVACQSPEFEIPLGSTADATNGSGGATNGSGGTTSGSGGAAGAGGAEPDHCDNGAPDADETGSDCGGRDCQRCRVGEPCRIAMDCENGECTGGICRDASCTDELIDGVETDIDCGGAECPPCASGRSCRVASDCTSNNCSDDRICEQASCIDRIHNGSETDVDCGGSCPGCEVGDACLLSTDCESPPNSDSESVSCDVESERCRLLCGRGTADCNQTASDGCEVALNVDFLNCGACGNECNFANAEAQCQGGSCAIVACADGFSNCNGLIEDGCEVELASDPLHCGECGARCSERNGVAGCSDGECSIECAAGFEDCNAALIDGCEANLTRSVDHCGECQRTCEATSGATPFCTEDQGCGETECEALVGDCDGDGECSDDLSAVADCGRCGNECNVPNGTPACEAAACVIESCDAGKEGTFADCDGLAENGCERNLENDRRFCGDCANDCTAILDEALHVTDVACADAGCSITSCESGFADCDADFTTGCEVDLTSDPAQCGGCTAAGGVDCTSEYANGSGVCQDSVCNFEACDSTFADCNQNAGAGSSRDGCETSIAFNDEACGACGVVCATGPGTESNACGGALGDTCVPVCAADFADCDDAPANGCEASLLSDVKHCGACGIQCRKNNGDNDCVDGVCTPDCDEDYLSCNDNPNDGCEQSIFVSAHCGDCDASCSAAGGGVAACSAPGECSVTCSGGNRNCNDENVARDGCETNTLTNADHCGSCGASCAATNVRTRVCTAGVCTPTCAAGFCPAPNPAAGCTVPLGTSANCASCGQSCAAPTPFCASDGGLHCDFLDVQVVSSDTSASNAWDATGALSVSHVLEGDASDYRMILLGISSLTAPETVSYGDVPLGEPALVNDSQSQIWLGVYVVLEEQLPTQASPQVTVQYDEWGWGQLNVVQFAGVDQNNPIVAATNSLSGNSTQCGTGSLRNAGLTFSGVPGSFVYALIAGRQASSASLQSGGFTETYNAISLTGPNSGEHGYMAAALSGPQANGSTAQWNMSGCYNSAGLAIGIRRAESL